MATEVLQLIHQKLQEGHLSESETGVLKRARNEIEKELIWEIGKMYLKDPFVPEVVRTTWQQLWNIWGLHIGRQFEITSCGKTEQELGELDLGGELYVPLELATQYNRHRLFEVFPDLFLSDYVPAGDPTINEVDQSGWIDSWIKPITEFYPRRTVEQIQQQMIARGHEGATLNVDIIQIAFNQAVSSVDPDRFRVVLGSRDLSDSLRSPLVTTALNSSYQLLRIIAFSKLSDLPNRTLDVHEVRVNPIKQQR